MKTQIKPELLGLQYSYTMEKNDYDLIVGIYKPHTSLRFNSIFHI